MPLSNQSKKGGGDDIILEAACDCFGLLASTIQKQYFSGDNFQKTVSRLGMLLRHESNKVRIAAGQTLAMLFEINGETTTGGNAGDEEGPKTKAERLQHSFYG